MAKNETAEKADAPKITPEDLQNKLQAFQGDIQGSVEAKKPSIAAVVAGGGMVLLIICFLLGKRSGKKKSAIVEIRRV
jgi:hypothetical protein